MQKSIIKIWKNICIGLVCLFFLFAVCPNIILWVSKPKIEKYFNSQINSKVIMGSLIYIFPRTILAKNVLLEKSSDQAIYINQLKLKLDPQHFLSKKEGPFPLIAMSGLKIFDDFEMSFIRQEIAGLKKHCSGRLNKKVQVSVGKVQIFLNNRQAEIPDFYLNSNVRFDNGFFLVEGEIQKNLKAPVYQFYIDGYAQKEEVILKKVRMYRENLDMLFWGSLQKNLLSLDGYSLISSKKLKNDKPEAASKADFYILDIKSRLELLSDTVNINYLSFLFNNIPVEVKGYASLASQPSYDLVMDFNLNKKDFFGYKNIDHIQFSVNGDVKKPFLADHGVMTVHFKNAVHNSFPITALGASFQNLGLRQKENRYVLGVSKGDVSYHQKEGEYKASFDNFEMSLESPGKDRKELWFMSNFYGGLVNGQARFDRTDLGPIVLSNIKFHNIHTDGVSKVFSSFADVDSFLSSEIFFTNYPSYDLRGEVSFHDGSFNNAIFFDWLSNYFSIPSLKKVKFDELTTQFVINKEGLKFKDVKLLSSGINVEGSFLVDNSDFVTSKFSFDFSRDVLAESPHFKPLIRKADYKDYRVFDFDFQLSGNVNAMNFQWTQSALKSKLKETIPDFYQKRIENNIKSSIAN